jgi:hypothetical protein
LSLLPMFSCLSKILWGVRVNLFGMPESIRSDTLQRYARAERNAGPSVFERCTHSLTNSLFFVKIVFLLIIPERFQGLLITSSAKCCKI